MLRPALALPPQPHRPSHPPPLQSHLPLLPRLLLPPRPHLRAPASVLRFTTVNPTQSTQLPQPTPAPTLISSQTRARLFPLQLEQCSTHPLLIPIARPAAQASLCPWFLTTSSLSSRERSAWSLLTRSPSRISQASPPWLLFLPSRLLQPRLVRRT